ncbi:MAG: flavodoxin [Firmicutes bacterium ADurb.Bin193]|nr:MAG: flavodoxin [Firmicutes bacterium ADurb.Bin193]
MKTAIIFYSAHHKNTKKLLDAIAVKNAVDLIDVTENSTRNLSAYDRIGFASGIYFGKYNKSLLEFAQKDLPQNKKVFFIHTAGDPRENHNLAIKKITEAKMCGCLGTYFCKGFDTYGPFKLIGGIAKGHPNAEEVEKAVEFYQHL